MHPCILADKSKVYKIREFPLWFLQSLLHIIGVHDDGSFSIFNGCVEHDCLMPFLLLPSLCRICICIWMFLESYCENCTFCSQSFHRCHKDKKLRSHFPLSVVHTDMFVQGLLWLCSLPTYFTAILKCVRKVDAFYVIEHICFQGINVATNSALE